MTSRLFRPARGELLATLFSALLFFFAFPPFRLVGPVFVCLVPFAVVVSRAADRGNDSWSGVRLGMWFGIFAYGASIYWIATALLIFTKLAILGYLGALFVITVLAAATGGALYAARRSTGWPMAVLLPVVWVASEVAMNHLSDLAFPWLPLGLAVTHTPALAQIADISGVHGVSFWIALTNGLVVDMWLSRTARRANLYRGGAIAALVCVVAGYGEWRLHTVTLRPLGSVGIVQPNIAENQKWDSTSIARIIDVLAAGTHQAEAQGHPQLVIWPETALNDYLPAHPAWSDSLRALTMGSGVPLLTGMIDVVWHSRTLYDEFNAAMLVGADGRVSQPIYHKRHLVPFVERVPFLSPDWFGWAGPYLTGSFGVGRGPVVYRVPFGQFGVLICYESIFPGESRQYRNDGADFLINITNDAWFGHTNAPYQHYSHLVLRAIENRVAIVRSANTGISGWIDPLGRIRAATPIFQPAAATYALETSDVRTLYDAWGDFVGLLSVAATLALVGSVWWTYRTERKRLA
ncbi:MAG: apolipoprotein N-acyltransferase [Gemmatimonadaceae bacterium]